MSGSVTIMEMPALGRSFQLGMLYDATTDKLIQGQELWDKDAIQNAQKDTPFIDTQFSVIIDDSLSTKSQHLDASSSVKMNLLAGLVNISGAAKFYDDYKSTEHAVRVSVHFKFLSKQQEVDIEQLGPIKDPTIISATRATHVVSRILFGLEAFLIIDRPYSVEEKYDIITIQKNMNDCAKSLAAMHESATTDVSVEIQEEAAKYCWKIYCDISLPTPSNLKDVISILENHFLKFFKEGASCSKVFPKKVWLHPLSMVISSAPTVQMQIRDSLIQQVEKILVSLYDASIYLNDTIKDNTEIQSTVVQEQLNRFLSLLAQFQINLKSHLSKMISKIRNGMMASNELTNFLNRVEKSPFGSSQLDSLKSNIDLEIRTISQYLQSLSSTVVKYVPFDKIDQFSIDFDYIVIFEFRFSENNIASIDRLAEYTQSNFGSESAIAQPYASTSKVNPWYIDKAKKRKLQVKAKILKEFAQMNIDNKNTAFIVTINSDISSFKDGARVTINANEEPTEFDLPSQPLQLQIKKDSGHEVCLTWSKPKYGFQNVSSYVISYFSTNKSIENHLIVKAKHTSTDSIVINDLDPEQEYQFIVQAKCIAGLSLRSEILRKFTKKPINYKSTKAKSKKRKSFMTAPTRQKKGSPQVTTNDREEQKLIEYEFPPSHFKSSSNMPSRIKPAPSQISNNAPIMLEFPPSCPDLTKTHYQLKSQRSTRKPTTEIDVSLLMQKISATKQPFLTSVLPLPEYQSIMSPLSADSPQQTKKIDELKTIDSFSQENEYDKQHKVQEEASGDAEFEPVVPSRAKVKVSVTKQSSEDQSINTLSTGSPQQKKKSDTLIKKISQENGSHDNEQHKMKEGTSTTELGAGFEPVVPSSAKLRVEESSAGQSALTSVLLPISQNPEDQLMPRVSADSPQAKKSDELQTIDSFSHESGSEEEEYEVHKETSVYAESEPVCHFSAKLTIPITEQNPKDQSMDTLSTDSPQQTRLTNIIDKFSQESGSHDTEQHVLQESKFDEKSEPVIHPGVRLIEDNKLPITVPKPQSRNVSYKSISLEWKKISFGRNKLQYYSVIYKVSDSSDSNQKEKKAESLEESITIDNLDCETGYRFQIRANFSSGIKLDSEPTVIYTKAHLAEKVRKNSQLISEKTAKTPAMYELIKTPVMVNDVKQIAKYKVGEGVDGGPVKVLMLVGATGAGKTTLINGIANYMYGVQWDDDFRFFLVANEPKTSQAHSQTSWITAYTLYRGDSSPIPYSLTIIDTPGFGDTEGIERDKKIADQIKEFFSVNPPQGIDILHGIGFVAQASLARLSHSQKYIFDSILSIYGNDVAKNIFVMTTFADGQDPPVMCAINEANIPHQNYFKFNNSALFVNGKGKKFDAMFWEMGMNSFENFFSDFGKAEHRSLQLTREVLREREELENVLQQLQPQIHIGLTKMDELQRVVIMLEHNKSLVEQNKEFVFRVSVTKQRMIDTFPGQYTTNCLNCNYTCHKNCTYSNNEDKKKCCAMNKEGNCRICPGNCIWSKHVNNPYIFEIYLEEEIRTSSELKDRYDTAKEGESRAEIMIKNIRHDVDTLTIIVLELVNKARKSLMRLDEIALKPNPLSEVDYIDLLIQSEEQQCKPGWMHRVTAFKTLRKRALLMRKIKDVSNLNEYDDVEEFLFGWLGEDGTSSSYTSQILHYLNPAEKIKQWYEHWKHKF